MDQKKTRSNLKAAVIYKSNAAGAHAGGKRIACMFNPFEYAVTKSNSYATASKDSDVPHKQFKEAGAKTLRLNLIFDTYESKTNVDEDIKELWEFMTPTVPVDPGKNKDKKRPPYVTFSWGDFNFVAVITTMTHKFTLFNKDGNPVRAKVDITFAQHIDKKDLEGQNPTSRSDQVLRTWQIIRGDRLDTIAAAVYGDAERWVDIAEYNELDNPLALRTGHTIMIPELE